MADEISIIKEDPKATNPKMPPKNGFWSYLTKVIRELIALTFWIYVIVKLMVFDIDVFLVNKFASEYTWLLNLKFFILIGLLALIFSVTKNKNILIWSAYILFYPFIVVFWKLPGLILKHESWILTFAFFNVVISFFKSIKYNFTVSAVFLCSMAILLIFSSPPLLWASILTICIALLIVYIRRFILVFKPSSVFLMHRKVFLWIRQHGPFSLDEKIRNLPIDHLDKGQLTIWTTNLQAAVIFNRACLFAAKKLQDYQGSGVNIISYVFTLLFLIILTVISFTGINYGLYKINPIFFRLTNTPGIFTFFYYSFNNLLFNSIQEIVPAKTISQGISMAESFLALILVAILISLVLSVRSQRYTEELNITIDEIKKQGKAMEGFIRDEYKLDSIGAAIAELGRLQVGLINFIYQMSKDLD